MQTELQFLANLMIGKELCIRRIVCYTGTSHSKAFVSSVIKFHDLTGLR